MVVPARNVGLRHGLLDNRPYRLACDSIEHIREALLRDLSDDLPWPAIDADIEEHWSRSGVPIPNVVMDELIVPDAPAGFRVETNDAVGEKIVAVPVAAVIVAGWCFDGKVDIAQLEIGAHRRPHGGVSGVLP